MIDGIGTDSPKLVKRNKRDGRNGSANKLESWAQSINRATAATILDDTRQKVRDTFAAFLGPALEARIPFAATYGNHDFQCGILADEQDDIYREFSGCMNPVAGSSPLALEPGTFAIPIEASDGSKRIAMSVMMVNSGDYADNAFDGDCSISDGCERVGDTDKSGNTVGNTAGGRESLTSYAKYASNSRGWDLADSDGYGTPSPEAIEWLKQVQRELGRRNGDGRAVPAIAFQHIPPQEFYDCLREVPAYTPNAVEGARTFAGHCYVLDRDVCRPGSRLGEAIGCADENVGEVQALRDAGGYFALFCGHDHKNAFVGHVHDIDLGYAPTCGFECYGPKSRLARHSSVRIPRKQSGQLRDVHAHVGRFGRTLFQQRTARVLRRPLRDRSGRHPQRTAPSTGHGHTAGRRIGDVRRSRPRHRQTVQALGATAARHGRRNSRTIDNLWNAENLWKICEISAEHQWNRLTPRRDAQNALPSQV